MEEHLQRYHSVHFILIELQDNYGAEDMSMAALPEVRGLQTDEVNI